ncbi:MAG: hypothetical protein PHD15_06575 [Clostridia bacterium]|nr:hypothetical protein [Clostridia bacterium]
MYNYYNDNMNFGNFPYWHHRFMPNRNFEMAFDFSDPYIGGYNSPMFMMNMQNYPQQQPQTQNIKINKKVLDLDNLIHKLWLEHAFWTKLAITSIASGLPDVQLVSQRLIRNSDDFAKAFLPIYGPTVAEQFRQLLKEHIITAADLVSALKKKDNASASLIEKRFFKNADDIADFLSRINPYWDRQHMRDMMHEHLNLIKALAAATLNNKYEEVITAFDKLEDQILMMADTFVDGILRQFPNKF